MANAEVKKTLTIVDRSTKAMAAASLTLEKVTAELKGIAQISTDLTQEIEFKQNELDALEADMSIKKRELAAELELRVKEHADGVLAKLLKDRGLISVEANAIVNLERQLAEAVADTTDAINKAVGAAVGAAKAAHANEIKILELTHMNAISATEANVKAAQERIEFLSAQNARLEAQIEADREARIEIARADAGRQGVIVNASGK